MGGLNPFMSYNEIISQFFPVKLLDISLRFLQYFIDQTQQPNIVGMTEADRPGFRLLRLR